MLAPDVDGNAERRREKKAGGHQARVANEQDGERHDRQGRDGEREDPRRGLEAGEVVARNERDRKHRLRGGEQREAEEHEEAPALRKKHDHRPESSERREP